MRILRGNRGTSIVEILVVMVVLLVGILTVVRLFPPGFTAVRRAESQTLAGRLAQYEIERWKNNIDNLPDGVLPIAQGATLLDGLYPGPPVDDNNALAFRRVIGETTRIPFGGWSTGPQAGSVYMLAYSPIDTTDPNVFAVRASDISRRVMDSTNTDPPAWKQLRPYEYGIDYTRSMICFPRSSSERTFYVAISWWEASGSTQQYRSTTDVKIVVPAGTVNWYDLKPLILAHVNAASSYEITLDDYSDTVSRGFALAGANWSTDDPYEYRMVDPVLGIIEFNPLGYSQREFGRPLEARVDYDIADLQIIHEDRRAPSDVEAGAAGPFRLRLTLNHIKEHGRSTNDDGNQYEGLPQYLWVDSGTPADVVVIDLATYRRVNPDSIMVDYKDGIVELSPQVNLMRWPSETTDPPPVPASGRNFRILYKAELEWSVQFQKAYSQYERVYDSGQGGAPALNYRSYYVEGSKVWFSACNANNTISVDYEYDDNGVARKVLGESQKTSDQLLPSGGVPCTSLVLKHLPTRIFAVNGISARARVIWKDGERWRHVDLDTTLVRRASSD